MKTLVREVFVKTEGTYYAIDLTSAVFSEVEKSGVRNGVVTVYSEDPMCPVFTIEYEPKLLSDLVTYIKGLSSDENKASLLAATVLGTSLTVPIVDGTPVTATFQQIVLLELNSEGGLRKVYLVIQGE